MDLSKRKLTSEKWGELFKINFLSYKGFPSIEYFKKVFVNKDSFLSMAANCDIEKPKEISRRAAIKMFKNLN